MQLGLINISKDGVNTIGAIYEPDTTLTSLFCRNSTRALFVILQASVPGELVFAKIIDTVYSVGLGTRFGSRSRYFDANLSSSIMYSDARTTLKTGFDNDYLAVTSLLERSFATIRVTLGLRLFGANCIILAL